MIEFKDVHKQFGAQKVLRGINMKIEEGEILFILGTSGTGKSVTLKLIVGLLSATKGEVWVNGTDVTEFSERQFLEVRRQCGMVFQHPALFDSFSIFENVAFGLRRLTNMNSSEIEERVRHCLDLVHVKNIDHKLPQEISYGTQKRVSLARTLAIEPQILLFDEPTTGLDPITTNAVNQLILELSRELKTTSVVVSHDMKCAIDIADRIIVLDGGLVIANGTPSEIMKSDHPLVRDFMMEVQND